MGFGRRVRRQLCLLPKTKRFGKTQPCPSIFAFFPRSGRTFATLKAISHQYNTGNSAFIFKAPLHDELYNRIKSRTGVYLNLATDLRRLAESDELCDGSAGGARSPAQWALRRRLQLVHQHVRQLLDAAVYPRSAKTVCSSHSLSSLMHNFDLSGSTQKFSRFSSTCLFRLLVSSSCTQKTRL